MQGLVKIGVLEKIWLWEMDFRARIGDLGPKGNLRPKWDFEGKWIWNRTFSENGYGKRTFEYKREILVKMVIWKNVLGKGLEPK